MNIIIKQELRDYIDPLTPQEYLALEQSLLKEGCRDALVLWGETLIDGHNRYAICQKHDVPFQTVQNDRFSNLEDVMLWMIDNHLARRSVSGFQRGVLALRKKEIVSARRKQDNEGKKPKEIALAESSRPPDAVSVETLDEIAKIAGISKPAVSQIEKIRKTASPELVDAVRAGTISINAAATIASLPTAQQVAAVAGGKKELQQAARQVREQRVKTLERPHNLDEDSDSSTETASANATTNNAESHTLDLKNANAELQKQVAALQEENSTLREKIAQLSASLAPADS